MNKNAICITVFKHRKSSILENLDKIDNSKYDIYIVTQENDPCKDEYFEYHGTVLTPNVKNIFEKREYVRMEMSNRGYDGFFTIDDDVKYIAHKITPESKRATSESYKPVQCDFNEMLDKMVETSIEYDAGYVCTKRFIYLGFSKPNRIGINVMLNCAQFIYFRLDKLNEHDLHYDTSGYVNEDLDMMIQCLQHGIKCCSVTDYGFSITNSMYNNMDTTTLYASIDDVCKFLMHNYVKYRIPLTLDTNGMLKHHCNYGKKYFNTFELPETDETMLALCKNDDVEGLIAYLKSIGKTNTPTGGRKKKKIE